MFRSIAGGRVAHRRDVARAVSPRRFGAARALLASTRTARAREQREQ
ncbi:hypothetical protein AB4Z48_21785 [Cupriavidus sp. 2TAF22]